MNTKKALSHTIRSLFGITLISMVLSSCSKDELAPASADASGMSATRQPVANPANDYPTTKPYEVIKINHIAARTSMPDYEVTIYSDMKALFEGRRNTSFIGMKYLTIDPKTFFMIKSMFRNSHLFDLQTDGVSTGGGLSDVPMVMTSYDNGTQIVTLTDYNEPDVTLYTIRTNTEKILRIDDLVFDASTQDKPGNLDKN